jgi:hypothetical protein
MTRKGTGDLPADVAKSVTRILGAGMTYDGHIAANAPGVALIARWACGGGRRQVAPNVG